MLFLSLEKAYNHVSSELIQETLNVKRVTGRYIRAIKDAKTCVRTSVGNTEYIPVEVGLH